MTSVRRFLHGGIPGGGLTLHLRGEFQRGVLTHTKWMGQWYSRSKEEGTLGHYAEGPTVQGGVTCIPGWYAEGFQQGGLTGLTHRGSMQSWDSNTVDWHARKYADGFYQLGLTHRGSMQRDSKKVEWQTECRTKEYLHIIEICGGIPAGGKSREEL